MIRSVLESKVSEHRAVGGLVTSAQVQGDEACRRGLGVFGELEGWNAQFGELEAKRAALVTSCASFGMDTPSFLGLLELA